MDELACDRRGDNESNDDNSDGVEGGAGQLQSMSSDRSMERTNEVRPMADRS